MRPPEDVTSLAKLVGLITWDSFVERACDNRAEKFYNGGWRGSKTWSADMEAMLYIMDFIQQSGDQLIWLIGPDYEQARPDYENLREWCSLLKLQVTASEAQQGGLLMSIRHRSLPGTILVATKSANHPQTLGAVGPRLIIACEAGQMSEAARDRIRGRTSTHNCPIIWNGTFENDQGAQQFAWFEEESARYAKEPTPRRKTYSLPIWENMALFGDCTVGENSILNDPTLIPFCPDDNHGPAHSGIDPNHPDKVEGTSGVPRHPKVREQYEECRDKPTYWRKYYAGEAVGVLNPVYEWANTNPDKYLVPMPPELKGNYPGAIQSNWFITAGGMDFGLGGDNHPSAVTVVSMARTGELWVRFSQKDYSGNMDWLYGLKTSLDAQFRITPGYWGGDRVATKYNPTYLGVKSVSDASSTRLGSVGVVNGYAATGRLFFDSTDPGVVELFRELQKVHKRKRADGSLVYARENDDMTASFEDAVVMLHQPLATIPDSVHLRRPKVKTFKQQRYARVSATRRAM